VSSLVNILLNIFLIPVYGAKGAAFAYIACFVVQLVLFKIYTRQDKVKPDLVLLLKTLVCASAAFLFVRQFIHNPFISVPAALLLYLLLGILTQLVVLKKIKTIIRLLLLK
jgi:O-antigen/teichoic acid export membrane protein